MYTVNQKKCKVGAADLHQYLWSTKLKHFTNLTSTNSLQNAAKMMQGGNTPLLALYDPNFILFSFTPFQRLVFTILV